MAEIFTTSGENNDSVVVPPPLLQGVFIPGIDDSQALDGFGLVTPFGGGNSTRKYGDYGLSAEVSGQDTQLRDLANAFVPGGVGGINYNLEGLVGPQGIPGLNGIDGVTTLLHLFGAPNSSFLTALPHNIDLINQLGTAADKLIYTDTFSSFGGITWAESRPAGDVNKTWQSLASSSNGGNLIAGTTLRLYTSNDSGATWAERQPAGAVNKNWQDVASNSDGSQLVAVVLGDKLYISTDYGDTWVAFDPGGFVAEQFWGGQGSGLNTLNAAQTFTTTGGYTLKRVALRLATGAGQPTTTATIKLYAVDGSSKPTGSSLYTIATITDADLQASYNWIQFPNLSYVLSATTEYAIVIDSSEGSVSWDGDSGYGDGIGWQYNTSTADWDNALIDFDFYCYSGDATNINWGCVDSDADGSNLIAGIFFGRLYTSDNNGVSWTERRPAGDSDKAWWCAASDSDGSHLIAGISNGRLYTSANSGVSWTERQPTGGADDRNWQRVASDSDGSHLIAANSLRLYTSADFGVNWTERQPAGAGDFDWEGVASNLDGSKLIAVANGDRVYISVDSGVNWTEEQPAGDSDLAWLAATSDDDGSHLMVGYSSGRTYTGVGTTTYSEATWAESTLTAAGRAILDDATAADQATTLGLGVGDSPTWVGATLSGLTSTRVLFAGVGGVISDDADMTFSGDRLTVTALTVTGSSVHGLNSAVFQPNADSTEFFQIYEVGGGEFAPIFSVDTVNKIVETKVLHSSFEDDEQVGLGTVHSI